MTKNYKKQKDEKKVTDDNTTHPILEAPPRVINIGLSSFSDDLKRQGVEVINLDWSPPARGNVELANLLAKLFYK